MIKNEPIAIDSNDIFANDLLDREGTINDLSELIISTTQPFVFCINADWGAGKTTFVRLWQAYLKKERKIDSIYFSAWKDDFSKDPLISILAELDAYIDTSENEEELKTEFERIKEGSTKIIKQILPQLIEKATGGVVESDLIKNLMEKPVNYYDDFKTSLEVLGKINGDQPFIIFIDELDRCRPLYAIEFLERIKHIFDIEKLIFVLAIDKENLAKSIKSQYGDIDTDNYLRRFIDLEYPLKNPSVDKFCAALYKKYNLEQILLSKTEDGISTILVEIQCLSASFNFSLRVIEQIFIKLHILFRTTEVIRNGGYYFFVMLVLFECLKTFDNQQYYQFLESNTELEIKQLVLEGFKKPDYPTIFLLGARIENIIWIMPYRKNYASHIVQKKQEELDNLIKVDQAHPTEDNYLIERWKDLGFYANPNFGIVYINKAIKKIEWVDKFNFDTNSKNTQ